LCESAALGRLAALVAGDAWTRGSLDLDQGGGGALSDQLPMPPFEIRRGVGAMGRYDLLLAISVVWLFILLGVMVYIIVI
jgi:hypothetical protein